MGDMVVVRNEPTTPAAVTMRSPGLVLFVPSPTTELSAERSALFRRMLAWACLMNSRHCIPGHAITPPSISTTTQQVAII